MRKRHPHRCLTGPAGAFVVLLAAAVFLSACGGGGGVGGGVGGGGGAAGPQTTAPRLPPIPSLPPLPPPPSMTPACIETVNDCLTRQNYEAARQTIEEGHDGEDDFSSQWGLSTIRADRAYAQLELEHGTGTVPGTGQTVGVIDDGIDQDHPVFAGKTVDETFFGSATDQTGDSFSHGTAVASIIAARRDASFTDPNANPAHGVAWGADIAMFAVPTGTGGGTYNPVSLASLDSADDRWGPRFTQVINWSSGGRTLDFVNLSIGFDGIVEQYSTRQLRDNLDAVITALAQSGASEKTVFVWSAGNAHGDPCEAAEFSSTPHLCVNGRVNARSVEVLPGLMARIPELREIMIAVVAIDEGGSIAGFSNRCGIAAPWCLAAPGAEVLVAYFGPINGVSGQRTNRAGNGTSYAAPMVTGALVVMKHYFQDQLSNTALLARLLATANKQGIYANHAIYGQGLLDLAAATAPVGITTIVLGNRVGGPGVDLTQTGFTLGNALGDGLTQALAAQDVAAFDELGAPFWYSLGAFARAADGPSQLVRLRRFMAPQSASRQVRVWRPALGAVETGDRPTGAAPLRFGLLDAPSQGAGSGHLSLAGRALSVRAAGQGGLGVAAFSTEGLDGRMPVSGAELSWRPDGVPLGLRGGLVSERAGLLGSRTAGAFGRLAAGSAFAGVEGQASIGPWRLGAVAEVGTVNALADGGLIADVSPLTTSAFALQAMRPLGEEGGAFTLSLSQPLRVEAGRARLSVPVGRTKDGRVRRQLLMADLEPTGRQIEVAAAWRRALGSQSELRLGAAWTRDPGHAAAAAPDLTVLAGLRHTF